MTGDLVIWTIYDHPTDRPEWWVVRRWVVRDGEAIPSHGLPYLCSSLAEARWRVPPGLHRIEREAGDDPVIVESWI